MKSTFIILQLFIITSLAGQEYYTRTGHVHVESYNKLKTIEADNHQVISFLNTETGQIIFEGLLRSFEFRLGALDRAVHSKNLDVSAYPKIKFEGKVKGIRAIDFSKPGTHKLNVKGMLYIWDEKRVTEATGTVKILPDGRLMATSAFIMRIEEQSMNKINALMKKKLPDIINVNTNTLGVSRDIEIDVDLEYKIKSW